MNSIELAIKNKSAKMPEAAAPAGEGAQAREAAEPAVQTETSAQTVTTAQTETSAQTVAPSRRASTAQFADTAQSSNRTDEDARFAALRRRAEADAQRKYGELIRELTQKAGVLTGQGNPPEQDEVEAAKAEPAVAALAGIPAEALAAAVQPIIQRAVEPVIRQAQETRAKAEVDAAMAAFLREYPDENIKDIADFLALPNYDAFYGYVVKGLTLSEAYMLCNRDAIVQKRAAAEKQKAISEIRSKDHLQSQKGSGGGDDVVVPRDTYKAYRQMMPDWTDAKIREHYAKSQKE